jgi:hypothetical protein
MSEPNDLPPNAKKLLIEMDKHPWEELSKWVNNALQATPENDRAIISKFLKRPWLDIESEIKKQISSKDYSKISKLKDSLFGLGNVNDPVTLSFMSTMNLISKDPKLEAYILHRYLGGKSKIKIVFMKY